MVPNCVQFRLIWGISHTRIYNVEREIHVNMALIKIHFELLSREACFYNEVSSALARAERVQERQGLPVAEAVQVTPWLKKV